MHAQMTSQSNPTLILDKHFKVISSCTCAGVAFKLLLYVCRSSIQATAVRVHAGVAYRLLLYVCRSSIQATAVRVHAGVAYRLLLYVCRSSIQATAVRVHAGVAYKLLPNNYSSFLLAKQIKYSLKVRASLKQSTTGIAGRKSEQV